MKPKKMFGAHLRVALAAVSVFCGTSFAQQTPFTQIPPQKVEKIEVTGSSIKRIEGETALPVTVITRADIERSGATTPSELLQLISSNNSSGSLSVSNVIGASTYSSQTASIRGLGGGRTLVLINGKRASGFAGEIGGVQGVNLAVIPFAAIERVEVLKDGASAVYGSDAIGGVINFILMQDYQGGEIAGYYGAPTRGGGGEQSTASLSAGFGDLAKDKFNVLVTISHNEQKHLDQRDRSFSNTSFKPEIGLNSTSSNTFPGNISTGGIGVITVNQAGVAARAAPNNCAPSTLLGGNCRFDPASVSGIQSIPDSKLSNFFGSATVRIDNNWQAYATAVYSKDVTHYVIQPVPISDVFFYGPLSTIPSTILLPTSSPFYPRELAQAAGVNGQPLNVRYRAYDNGPRDTTDTNKAGQFVIGIKGAVNNWDLDGSLVYGEGKTASRDNGGKPILPAILPILNSGRVNLFGPNTPEIVAELRATNFIGEALSAKSKNYGYQANAARELFHLPAGAVSFAIGADIRKESLAQQYAPELTGGLVSGYGGAYPNISGSRSIRALTAETSIPIVEGIEANFAVRSDDYSDFGKTTNPKVSLRWQPMPSILARAAYGKGFLAPSLYQLLIPNSGGVTIAGTSDPIRCPITGNAGIDCLTQFTTLNGGNSALRPEKSEQISAGLVFEPSNAFSMSVDYFKVRLNNSIINGIPISTILGDLNTYGYLVTRAAPDPAFPNLPGRIVSINQTYLNLGAVRLEGLDVEAHFRTPNTAWGRFRFDISGTYFIRNDIQNTDGTYSGFVSNQFGAPSSGVIPRWKHYASLTLESARWSTTLGTLFQSGYIDVNTDANGNLRTVSSMTLWDLQSSYRGYKNMTVTLGVKNLLDTNPPLTNQSTTFQAGYDPSYYDARARFVYANLKYAFK